MMAYLRRQQLEARIQAAEIGLLFGGSTGQGSPRSSVQGASGKSYRQVSPGAFLARVKG